MKKFILFMAGPTLLSGCLMTVPTFERSQAPDLFAALDSGPRGTAGQIDASTGFVIMDTKASDTLLCREVRIYTADANGTRDYCKIRGGEWK